MNSYLTGSIELVGGILNERFGKRSQLFNDPITTLQICQHIIKIGIEKSEYLHPQKKNALKVGKEIFKALNLYSSGHHNDARKQVERVIERVSKTEPTIKWPDAVKKGYAKFTKSFPTAFEKGNQAQALNVVESFDAILEDGKNNPHVFAIKDTLLDLRKAVKDWNLVKIEDTFYGVSDYYYDDLSLEEPSLVST
jgi:hypothetical protein